MDIKMINYFEERFGDRFLQNFSMAEIASFHAGGSAEAIVFPKTQQELLDAIRTCVNFGIPWMIVGRATNLLVLDGGIRGMVIALNRGMDSIRIEENDLIAESGALLSKIALTARDHALTGVEFASGIPGSLGGAIAMNAGAYGGEMAQVVKEVTVSDSKGNCFRWSLEELQFGRRNSRILREGAVVLEARLTLHPGDRAMITAMMEDLNQRRRDKQPLEHFSAGSVFKRPIGNYASKLIQDAGLKGLHFRGAEVSSKHSGFIINRGHAKADDILTLIEMVEKLIFEEYGIVLEREIQVLGERDD